MKRAHRRGFLFTTDAILGGLLLLAAAVVLIQFYHAPDPVTQTTYYAQDALLALSTLTIGELDDPWVESLVNNSLADPDRSIIEQIGTFWATNQSALATNLTELALDDLLGARLGLALSIGDTQYYLRNETERSGRSVSRRMITGIEQGRAISGASSAAYLTRIQGRPLARYIYFGGFVGQGNLSAHMELPTDLNASGVREIIFEADIEKEFTIHINGAQCGGTYSPSNIGDNFTPDWFNLSSCDGLLQPGENLFEIEFQGVNDAYIGGGFLKVEYTTQQFRETIELGRERKRLPGIDGIVNLYDSFSVPGELTSLDIHLHYFANHSNVTNLTFYLNVGNTTILADDNSTTEQFVTFNNTQLSSLLNYSLFSRSTVPLRIGFQNLSFATTFLGNADVMIITDVSGSMDWRMDNDNVGTPRNCGDAGYNTSSTARLSVAKCLDNLFAIELLNVSGNRVGLVSYDGGTHVGETVAPTANYTLINATIGTAVPETGYEASGSTCVCCGINSAEDTLTADISRTVVVPTGSTWIATDDYLFSTPPMDGNLSWFEPGYDESIFTKSGPAVIGATNALTYNPVVVTELDANLTQNETEVNLWEHVTDTPGAPNDFTSNILNTTGNTYGIGAGDDGWDTDSIDGSGPFGYDDDYTYSVTGGQLVIENSAGNTCSGRDCSGAYGIEVEITPQMYARIGGGGRAWVSFDYTWTSNPTNPFGDGDELWVKAAWSSPFSGRHGLGSEMSNAGIDTLEEIDFRTNPDSDIIGTHTQYIEQWIEGAGQYYLELGGMVAGGANDDWGVFTFDNVQIIIEEPDTGVIFADLWEHTTDIFGPPVDFSGGTLNSSANTYGRGAGDDGWDWDLVDGSGPFGFDDDCSYPGIDGSGRLEITNGGSNSCDGNDCSCSYGVEVEITPAMYDTITNGGVARLDFWYQWDDRGGNVFENEDQAWIKSRWTAPGGAQHYLGDDLDLGDEGFDPELDVYTTDNPDNDFEGLFSQDIASYITGPGQYYLELGGKLVASESQEYGWWRFDNIQLRISNHTNRYYLRHHFNLADANGRGVLNVLADDRATVYLNGNEIAKTAGTGGLTHRGEYWNIQGESVSRGHFRVGDNVLAVLLENEAAAAKLDLELIFLNNSQELAMMVMSDGVANVQCPAQGTGDAVDDAIQAACEAKQDWGITVYSVGYSSNADEEALQGIAQCGGGEFFKSDDTRELQEFYSDVAFSIIEASIQSQTVVVQGAYEASTLFNDSHVNITFIPAATENTSGLELVFQTEQFNSCTPTLNLTPGLRLIDAVMTSYSGQHWTDFVSVNGQPVFNLSAYNPVYAALGDPYLVTIPVDTLISGPGNQFVISTGDSALNSTGCSDNNTLIYRGFVNSSTTRSEVVEETFGCTWTIEFEDGQMLTTRIPTDYAGSDNCTYNSTTYPGVFDPADAYDLSVAEILNDLDFDDDGRVLINLADRDLQIIVTVVEGIPYLWGPSMARVEVWE